MRLLLILLTIFISACTITTGKPIEKTVYVTTPLSLPARPELPRMSSDALQCISEESKWALLKRDVLLKDYISQLETIINSTHSSSGSD